MMKNKVELKRYLCLNGVLFICILIVFSCIHFYEYRVYTKNFNDKICQIVSVLKEDYPSITEKEIMEVLNNDTNTNEEFFEKYGIYLTEDSILLSNDRSHRIFSVLQLMVLVFGMSAVILLFFRYHRKKEKSIQDITEYIEQINRKNYELKIDTISEDELSILKNEVYKTTVMLKEAAENSNMDKLNLKKSLEDISHQLKTPLTSVLIMLDNVIDDPEMDPSVRNEFLRDMKRDVVNIHFLVQAILKLSKFDANTIHFIKSDTKVKKILEHAVKNISTLCDLRNIHIEVFCPEELEIYCDFRWQVEAFTNILKNCAEHSKDHQKLEIHCSENRVYTMIEIRDYGKGISKKDLPHIFERFYKGENASSESTGIGLALAKTILEEDNGMVSVDSSKEGTTFAIKFMK